ncbi:MAG TPA: hypothetical protein VJB41_02060 [Patescibacteria group bacterium]|nr:hypothetical protein [Patescibacteria group bacterium]
MNKKIKIALSILAILLGIFMFIYGEYDDSPGGQLLGVLAVVGGIVGVIALLRNNLSAVISIFR